MTDMFILAARDGATTASKAKTSSNIEFLFTINVSTNTAPCRLTEKWVTAFDVTL